MLYPSYSHPLLPAYTTLANPLSPLLTPRILIVPTYRSRTLPHTAMSTLNPTMISGKLLKVRELSKKLAFADLELSVVASAADPLPAPSVPPSVEFVELVIKTSSTLPSVKEALRPLRLGDTLTVLGFFEEPKGDERPHRTFKVSEPPTVSSRLSAEETFHPKFTLCQPINSTDSLTTAVSSSPAPLCKYYTNTKTCPRGDGCRFLHTADKEIRASYFSDRERRRIETELALSSSVPPLAPTPSDESKASRTNRASAFADFLVEQVRS